jgi:hypothetical protein
MNGLNICPKCGVVIGTYGQCNCNSRRPAWVSLLRFLRLLTAIAVLALGMYGSVQAQHADYCDDHPTAPECEDIEDWPIIGPGPCHSDTPWGCYEFQVWMPVIGGGS